MLPSVFRVLHHFRSSGSGFGVGSFLAALVLVSCGLQSSVGAAAEPGTAASSALDLPMKAAPLPAAPLPPGSRVQVTVTRLPGSPLRTSDGATAERSPEDSEDNLSITFDWPVPVGVVALRRGDVLLFGFDRAMPADLPEQLQSVGPLLRGLSRARGDGDVLAVRLPRHRAEVSGGGRRWTLRLVRTDDAVEGAAIRDADRAAIGDSGKSSLLVPLQEPRGPATVMDPLAGDRLYLFSSRRGGQPYPEGLGLLFVEVLPTLQGLALRPLADGVVVRPQDDGVRVGWRHPSIERAGPPSAPLDATEGEAPPRGASDAATPPAAFPGDATPGSALPIRRRDETIGGGSPNPAAGGGSPNPAARPPRWAGAPAVRDVT